MSSRRLRGLAPEIDPKTSPSRQSRAERRARRSRAIAKAEDAPFQAVAADDAQKGNAASQVAVHSQATAKMPETNAGGHSEHTGGLDSPHNSSPASPLGILAGVSGLARHMGLPAESPAKSIDNRTYHGPERFACQKPIKFGPGRLNVADFEIGPCSAACGTVGPVPYDCGCSGAFQSALNKGDAIKQIIALTSHIDKYESESESDSDSSDSDSSDSDDSDSSDSDSDSDSDDSDSVPVVPKKRVKLVAKKAGGPGASRKRSALPAGRPKKRAKQGGIIASYSKKELKASRALSLKNFIKEKLLISRTIDKRQLRAGSFVCNAAGKPIGTSPAEMNRAYKAWALTAKGKYVGTGMDGHLKDRCSRQCCANGHRLNVCPALKTHLAHKLGRKMTAKEKLWKSGDGFYYYKGAFLKK